MAEFDPRIGQRFVVGFHGVEAPDHILEWLRVGRIGGVILFERNVESAEQLANLTRSLHSASETPILIGIDQEGGMVTRLKHAYGFTESSGAMALAASENKLELTERMSRLLADEMKAIGINWTYAPVVDLSYNAENPTVGTRSFGRDPQQVGALAGRATRGFQSGGVIACAKHFPGLGDTTIDSHLDLPTLDTPLEQLVGEDLEPYRQVIDAGLDSIMTTHTIFSALDSEHPATLSEHIIQNLIRDELGFEGLVCTDCLEMHAITKHYGEGEASVRGIIAGIDTLLISHTRSHQEAAFVAVDEAVKSGRISEENIASAYERIMRIKAAYRIDVEAIDPEQVGTDEHIAESIEIAQAGVSLSGVMPSLEGKQIGAIEFGAFRDSDVMETDPLTGFLKILGEQFPPVPIARLNAREPNDEQIEQALALASSVDVIIVATRNAHVFASQREVAQRLLSSADASILIALRNPYDEDVLTADAVLCTFGASTPSLTAAINAIKGLYQPTGQRPSAATV